MTCKKCIKLDELPVVTSEGQQEVYEPDCKFYGEHAECHNPARDHGGQCPFEGKELPVKLVDDDTRKK